MMGREALRAYLKSRHAAETPLKPHETPEQGMGFQQKIFMNQGFISTETPETLETSINTDSRENFQTRPLSEAVNDPTSAGRHGLQKPAPGAPAKRLKYLEWADGWLELDKAYQRHHWSCPQCKAAGRRANGQRCGVGAALYRDYEDASADRSALDW